jgi:hypothetical protein
MSDYLLLEIDAEQIKEIEVVLDNGLSAGKALFSFLSTLSCYFDPRISNGNDVIEWFSGIKKVILDIEILAESWYQGDWNYSTDEYERFLQETSLSTFSKERFISSVRQVEEKWKDIRETEEAVTELISELQSNPEEYFNTWFFDQHYSLKELEALARSLQMGIMQGARKVRLRFY